MRTSEAKMQDSDYDFIAVLHGHKGPLAFSQRPKVLVAGLCSKI